MSKTSIQTGRLVKLKRNPDAENVDKNDGSLMEVTTSLSTTSANKGIPSKIISVEEKSPKRDTALKNQHDVIKYSTIKGSIPSSPEKDKATKPDNRAVPELEATNAQVVATPIDTTEVELEMGSPIVSDKQKEGNAREITTPSSAVRRSGRAPVPSSRYKDMELDIRKSKKRLNTSEDSEAELERVKKSRKTSDKPATDTKDVLNKSTRSTSVNVSSKIYSSAVLLVPLTIDDLVHSNLNEADLQKERGTAKDTNSTESVEMQTADVSEQSTLEQNSTSKPNQGIELSMPTVVDMATVFPKIKIGGQEVTFTERDGETVAVVTIPSSSLKEEAIKEHTVLDSSTQENSITFETVDSEQEKRNFSELVTVNSTIHNLGHVMKRDNVETPFATVVGHDGATYLNLSVEATKISSILKGKNVAATAKSTNPLKGHGRVLRSPVGSMIMKTTIVPPRTPQQEVLEVKPSVTFSLLCPKKPQVDQCTYSVTRTVALPVSVLSQVNQSPQRIVIRQQSQQSTVSEVAATKPSELSTVINFPQELPLKNMTAPAYSTDDSKPPKTASEILLQRLKLQSKLATAKEINQTNEIVSRESTSTQGTNDLETIETMEDVLTTQQIISENNEHMNVSHTSHDGAEDNSHYVLSLDVEDSSKRKKTNVDSAENFIVTVRMDTQDEDASKDLTDHVLSESAHVDHEEDIAASSVNQTIAENRTEKTNISEEGVVINTSDDTTENQTSSTTISVLTNVAPKDIKASISSENLLASAECDSDEQKPVTKLVSLSSLSSLATASISKDKDHFIDKIRVVDNGVEYDVRIVSEEEVAEEIIDNAASHIIQNDAKQSEGSTAEVKPEIIIKQEIVDEDLKSGVEKQTSGTQTVYSPHVKNVTSLSGANATTTHTLATVVDEGSEKKHVYYVSVIPNKGIMAKTKTSMYSSAASWVIDDNGMYCCEKCDYQTDRKANFYKHCRSHTGAKPHVCSVCQYKAGTSSNLKRHMGIHKDIREHKCDICNLCFRQKIHLERHVKYKHEEKSIKCPMCEYICANEQPDLKMHIKRKHSTESSGEMVTCPECKAQVGNRKDLKQHMKFHREGPELKLFCKDCSFVTDCQSRLKRHTAIHSKMKPFQCGICNYRAAQKEHVLRHLRTQHKIDIKRDGKRPWKRHKKSALDDGSKERADFTSGDKIFACNHCTMRFAKLINLYKHLHTQHGDIMPTETDGNFYCVVCEFSTTNKKNLLVHMRRHNMTDQTPPTHVYSCVLCRYVNPRRRNLFQHMRKKHNINISRQSDGMDGDEDGDELEVSDIIGSVNRALTSNSNTVSVSTTGTPESSSREVSGDLTSVASVIKIEDLTRMASGGDNDDLQALVIDSRAADVTEVVHTTANAADALEGLQALAEQAGLIENIIEEQVPVMDEQQTVEIEQNGSTAEVVGTVETVGDQLQHIIQSTESLTSAGGEVAEGLELSEDQLSSLRNGDMVEMEGHLYLVELTQDPSSPNKQVFSFLPVTTASISQDVAPD